MESAVDLVHWVRAYGGWSCGQRGAYFSLNLPSRVIIPLFIGRPHLEVHHALISGAVYLLRLRQRLTERRAHAVGYCPLDLSECG